MLHNAFAANPEKWYYCTVAFVNVPVFDYIFVDLSKRPGLGVSQAI